MVGFKAVKKGGAILVLAALLASCRFTPVGNEGATDSRDIGGVTYIASTNILEILKLINEGQTGNNGEHYGDAGTVVEWDVDFGYLIDYMRQDYAGDDDPYRPAGLPDDVSQRTAWLTDRVNLPGGGLPNNAWFKVELWGADGGNVDTKDAGNYSETQIRDNWGQDHFNTHDAFSDDFAYGGKGGYMAAYVKLHQGNVIYFFVGGKGKDGTVITGGVGEEVIYGFNGGGKGSGGHQDSYMNGAGGGGATSMAYHMAKFAQAVSVEESDGIPAGTPVWKDEAGNYHISEASAEGWSKVWQYNFHEGWVPQLSGPPLVTANQHYGARLLVAGGGGGGGQAHNTPWHSLHGGNGNGGFGEEKAGGTANTGWKTAQSGAKSTKTAEVTSMGVAAFDPTVFAIGGRDGYRQTAAATTATYSLVYPPFAFGKGLDAGDATVSGSYNEGRGGGGGGFTGGGAVFNVALPDNGGLSSTKFPTAAGTGGTNGYFGMTETTPGIQGNAPAAAVTATIPRLTSSFVQAPQGTLIRDPDTLLIQNPYAANAVVSIKVLTNYGTGEGNTGADGLSGVKTPAHLERFPQIDLKGNGFISINLIKFNAGENYTVGSPVDSSAE